jgi:polyisoprenoid-binding protein YceI
MNKLRKFACALIILSTSNALYAAQVYTLDKDHTYAEWSVNHFGFSNVTGKFMAEGTLTFDADHPDKSSVNVIIHTDNPNTGIPKLDDLLKGKNFFDIAEYPTATFQSKKVEMTGKDTGKVYGTLTIRGISKDVTLNVKLVNHKTHPYYQKDALGFSADTSLQRSDFGIRGYLPGVSDDTNITINSEAIQADNQGNKS